MLKFFKRTKNFVRTVFINALVWMMTNVWTSPLFMSVINIVSVYAPMKMYLRKAMDWVNRYVEDHLIYFNKERRVAFVVEADNALGYSLCKKLVKKNYHVVLGVSEVKTGLSMKSKLLQIRSYASVSIIPIDMCNPMNVLYASKRLYQNYQSLDVLYLNNSSIHIDHMNWEVLIEAFKKLKLSYFCTTGRVSDSGPNFVSVKGSGITDLGFSKDFCQQVLSPFILAMELKDLLKEANLPGRIVWTGSSTCSSASFSFDDLQHIRDEDSFYAHKYFVHLIQPSLNEYLSHTDVKSFEGCPGLIITGTSPRVIRRWTWLLYFIGLFIPSVQIYAISGSRTLLLLGTHRNQYKSLEPNHMYTMRRRMFGLRKCRFVEDIDIVQSRRAMAWLYDLYKKLKRSDILVDGVTEEVRHFSDMNSVIRCRRSSIG